MITNVVYRSVEPTPATKQLVEAAKQALQPFFKDLVSLDWRIGFERGLALVGCQLHSRSGYYRANAKGKSFAAAFDEVVDRLLAQRRRRKSERVSRRRRPAARASVATKGRSS